MTLRPTPRAATWFLKEFGSATESESVIGDLTEQYQRGRGSLWYWRQVLAIVFVGHYRELQRDKRSLLVGLFHSWCVWGGLQFTAGVLLMSRYALLHPEQLRSGISVYGFPLLTLRAGMREQWEIILLSLFLNVTTLLLVGAYSASKSQNHPRTTLLMYVTSFVVFTAGHMVTDLLLMIFQNQPDAMGWLIRDLIALPLAPALLLLGAGLARKKTEQVIGERGV